MRRAALSWLRLAFLLITLSALAIAVADRAPAAHLPNNFPPDQCTWWVVERFKETGAGEAADEIINWPRPRHAYLWLEHARASGWSDGTEPRVGAIAWWPASRYPYGHVAYVEEVLDFESFRVSEQNFPEKAGPRSDRVLSASDEVARGTRFIYPPSAQVEVTGGLVVHPIPANVGESVTATFTLSNRGQTRAVLDRVGVSVRGPQPEESIVDFEFATDVVIQPNESYEFESSRSFAQPGTYRLNAWIEVSGRGEIPKGEEQQTQVETTLEVVGTPQPSGPNQAPVARLRICTVTDHCIAEHEILELTAGPGTIRFYAFAEDDPDVVLSYDPEGHPLGFEWLINGPPVYSRSPDFEFDSALLQPGENHVLLRVGDDTGAVTEVGATIVVIDAATGVRPVIVDPAQDAPTAEGQIALSARAAEGTFEIWTVKPDGSDLARLSDTNAARYLAIEPSWAGSGVLYARVLAGTGQMGEIWLASTDGAPERLVFASDEIYANAPAMAPDGELIAFAGRNAGKVQPHDLFVVNADGTNPRQLTDHPEDFKVRFVSWSPDGTRLAYSVRPQNLDPMRDSLGNQQVYVYDFSTDATTLVGPHIADTAWIDPAWSSDGSQLLIAELNELTRRLLLVDPTTGESREIATWSHDVPWTTSEVGPDLESPVWSPDDRFIAFVFNGQIHIMGADGGSLFSVPGLEPLNVRHAIDWR